MPVITSEIFTAYQCCTRKAFLANQKEKGDVLEFNQITENRKRYSINKFIAELDITTYVNREFEKIPKLSSLHEYHIYGKLTYKDLSANFTILKRTDKRHYIPIIFTGTYNVDKFHKLELFWISYVLSQFLKEQPAYGRINTLSKSIKTKITNLNRTILPALDEIKDLLSKKKPPEIVLNKHCKLCEHQQTCRKQAVQEDSLSLLGRITPKMIAQYNRKGIFTVKQLSYLYRPPKKSKKLRRVIKHRPEIQALAIRTQKIYLQHKPEVRKNKVEVFIDFESIPDESFYYLFGVLVCENCTQQYFSFWAETKKDEADIWRKFLQLLTKYPQTIVYHYGDCELRAIRTLGKRYKTDISKLEQSLINVNKFVYGKVYFPVFSNGLKDIAKYLGASWTEPNASSLQSIVWRYNWQEKQKKYKETIITYNREGCEALKLLKEKLSEINESAQLLSDIEFVSEPKNLASETNKEIQKDFELVLKLSYSHYNQSKISFVEHKPQEKTYKRIGYKKDFEGQRKKRPKPSKTIIVLDEKFCSIHQKFKLQTLNKNVKRLIIDLILTKNGIRKTITEYIGKYGYCSKCHRNYSPAQIKKYGKSQLYGHNFKSWFVNHRIAHRLPFNRITEIFEEAFCEKVSEERIYGFIEEFSETYKETIVLVWQNILSSSFIHADETTVNIRGKNQYAWVFTIGKYVIFKHSITREADTAHEFLKNYKGVLISDFYTGYDAIPCRQQKCWVHLIRDMNNDLRKYPFDIEYERFVFEVKNLFVPIMEAVHKYGLKKRNLNKFRKKVDEFYKETIYEKYYKSETTKKYHARFQKYKDSLFTFLEEDNIPWHNNTAELAIRHIVKQQAVSGYFHERTMDSYLTMLSIRQTCRFQDKSFFRFLCSKELDIDKFKDKR